MLLFLYIKCFCLSGQFEVSSPTVTHYRGGMRANYTVEKCSLFQRQSEIMLHSKTYYIAAMEMNWDYSPKRTWETEMFRGHEKYGTVYTQLHTSAACTCLQLSALPLFVRNTSLPFLFAALRLCSWTSRVAS